MRLTSTRVRTVGTVVGGLVLASPVGVLLAHSGSVAGADQGTPGVGSMTTTSGQGSPSTTPGASPQTCGWSVVETAGGGSNYTSDLWYNSCNRNVKAELIDPSGDSCNTNNDTWCDGAILGDCTNGGYYDEKDIPNGQTSVFSTPTTGRSDAGITSKALRFGSTGVGSPATSCF
jgi:hypothetical protein